MNWSLVFCLSSWWKLQQSFALTIEKEIKGKVQNGLTVANQDFRISVKLGFGQYFLLQEKAVITDKDIWEQNHNIECLYYDDDEAALLSFQYH